MEGMTSPTGPAEQTPEPEVTVEEENLLARSARALAAEDPEGFIDLNARVRSTVRATTRRSRPVHATFPHTDGGEDDTLVVREWVLVGQLREVVTGIRGVTPTQIVVGLDADRCSSARVHITAIYGAVLADAAGVVRDIVGATLSEILGTDALPTGGVPVDVVIDDVTP